MLSWVLESIWRKKSSPFLDTRLSTVPNSEIGIVFRILKILIALSRAYPSIEKCPRRKKSCGRFLSCRILSSTISLWLFDPHWKWPGQFSRENVLQIIPPGNFQIGQLLFKKRLVLYLLSDYFLVMLYIPPSMQNFSPANLSSIPFRSLNPVKGVYYWNY